MFESFSRSPDFGWMIRDRRVEMGKTVGDMARLAGVSEATWRNYENGYSSPRSDKLPGVLAALQWDQFAEEESLEASGLFPPTWDVSREDMGDTYSELLEGTIGETGARTFALGVMVLRGVLSDDINQLSTLPRGSHLGMVDFSPTAASLPRPWLTRYDYEFVTHFLCRIEEFVARLVIYPSVEPQPLVWCVADVLALRCIFTTGCFVAHTAGEDLLEDIQKWQTALAEADEIVQQIFSANFFPDPESYLHFDNWFVFFDDAFVPKWRRHRVADVPAGEHTATVTLLQPRGYTPS